MLLACKLRTYAGQRRCEAGRGVHTCGRSVPGSAFEPEYTHLFCWRVPLNTWRPRVGFDLDRGTSLIRNSPPP